MGNKGYKGNQRNIERLRNHLAGLASQPNPVAPPRTNPFSKIKQVAEEYQLQVKAFLKEKFKPCLTKVFGTRGREPTERAPELAVFAPTKPDSSENMDSTSAANASVKKPQTSDSSNTAKVN